MAISNAETKENLVRKSNQRVIDAEKAANAKRASLQEKLNTLVKDFKSEFKVTTVDEDYAAQLKVLEASYQARKEMAEKNNLDTTELDSAYLRAKEQLESEHQQRIQSIRDQYGLSTQQERFNAELEQLRLAREQQFLTEEQYEQAVQNLKRDSYKSSLTIIPVCFPRPFKHCSKRKWTRSMQNMMRKLRQPKVIRKKWNVWKTKRPRESLIYRKICGREFCNQGITNHRRYSCINHESIC